MFSSDPDEPSAKSPQQHPEHSTATAETQQHPERTRSRNAGDAEQNSPVVDNLICKAGDSLDLDKRREYPRLQHHLWHGCILGGKFYASECRCKDEECIDFSAATRTAWGGIEVHIPVLHKPIGAVLSTATNNPELVTTGKTRLRTNDVCVVMFDRKKVLAEADKHFPGVSDDETRLRQLLARIFHVRADPEVRPSESVRAAGLRFVKIVYGGPRAILGPVKFLPKDSPSLEALDLRAKIGIGPCMMLRHDQVSFVFPCGPDTIVEKGDWFFFPESADGRMRKFMEGGEPWGQKSTGIGNEDGRRDAGKIWQCIAEPEFLQRFVLDRVSPAIKSPLIDLAEHLPSAQAAEYHTMISAIQQLAARVKSATVLSAQQRERLNLKNRRCFLHYLIASSEDREKYKRGWEKSQVSFPQLFDFQGKNYFLGHTLEGLVTLIANMLRHCEDTKRSASGHEQAQPILLLLEDDCREFLANIERTSGGAKGTAVASNFRDTQEPRSSFRFSSISLSFMLMRRILDREVVPEFVNIVEDCNRVLQKVDDYLNMRTEGDFLDADETLCDHDQNFLLHLYIKWAGKSWSEPREDRIARLRAEIRELREHHVRVFGEGRWCDICARKNSWNETSLDLAKQTAEFATDREIVAFLTPERGHP